MAFKDAFKDMDEKIDKAKKDAGDAFEKAKEDLKK